MLELLVMVYEIKNYLLVLRMFFTYENDDK